MPTSEPLLHGAHHLVQNVGQRYPGRYLPQHPPFHVDLLLQSFLRVLVLGDVAGDAEQAHGPSLRRAHDRALERHPVHLAGMRVAGRMHHPVLRIPGAAGALDFREGRVDPRPVIGMDEAPAFLDRRRRHAVPMNERDARIAVEAPAGKIHAECAELGSPEGQLKALVAVLQPLIAVPERRLAAAPLVEQCGQHQGAQRRDEHGDLRGVHALEHGRARIAEAADAESRRRHQAQWRR